MTDLHLFEFTESGFFAARDRDHAVALVMIYTGFDETEVMGDFARDVSDDEMVEVCSEESWDDPSERVVFPNEEKYSKYKVYFVTRSAKIWANEGADEDRAGYRFGGEE